MALDDFVEEAESTDKEIKTRKKIKNVTLPEEFWIHLICTDPSWAAVAANYSDEDTTAKAIVSKMQDVLEDEPEGHNVNPVLEGDIEDEIDNIVENNLQ